MVSKEGLSVSIWLRVHAFLIDIAMTSMWLCPSSIFPESLMWLLSSKTILPLTFSPWHRPISWAALAAVRHTVPCSEASDVLTFALSVTAADWQWLPVWQSLSQLPHGLGSKCYHYCEEGCHHSLHLEHGSTHSESGSSALVFSVVWMTRYYSSCRATGSCTP